MPFIVIGGSYHLVGQTPSGKASGFEPDGDSMQFKPDDPSLLDRLERLGSPYRLTKIGSTQLRFEGIDALELHFDGGHHQPRPLADQSRDWLTGALAMNPVPYTPPDDIRVAPPISKDGAPGFILSRALEAHGRPVAFAFAGKPPGSDGSTVVLKPGLVRQSLNYRSLQAGQSYPLFYDTLFSDLRATFTKAAGTARQAKRGIWSKDRTTKGLKVSDETQLEQDGVIFPKLFRRLTTYLTGASAGALDGFLHFLAKSKEQVLDLRTGNFTHFDNVVSVKSGSVSLSRKPEELVFLSAKPQTTGKAPWLTL